MNIFEVPPKLQGGQHIPVPTAEQRKQALDRFLERIRAEGPGTRAGAA